MAGFVELLRRNRNYRYTWIGQLVSEIGDHFNTIAVFSLALNNTGSGMIVSGLMISRAIPAVLAGPLAGVLLPPSDEENLRRRLTRANESVEYWKSRAERRGAVVDRLKQELDATKARLLEVQAHAMQRKRRELVASVLEQILATRVGRRLSTFLARWAYLLVLLCVVGVLFKSWSSELSASGGVVHPSVLTRFAENFFWVYTVTQFLAVALAKAGI